MHRLKFSDLHECHTCLKMSYTAICAFIGECSYAVRIRHNTLHPVSLLHLKNTAEEMC